MTSMPADKNRRVLVLDDNRALHEDFRKILSPSTAMAAATDATEAAVFGPAAKAIPQTPFEVDSAYQGQEGVLLVKEALEAGRPYALAFIDVRMPPGWDGVETSRKIWEIDPDIQIVLCTAFSDYSWDEMFAKLGQRDGLLILKKPFDAVEAFQLAHALTEKWCLHRQSRRKMEELEGMFAERTRELRREQTELRVLFDLTPAMICFKDTENRVLRANKRLAETVGKPVEEIEGKPTSDFFPEEAAKFYADDLEVIRSGEAKLGIIETVRDGKGNELWVQTDKVPFCDPDGKVIGIVVLTRDITKLKQTETALMETGALLETLLENATDHIYFKDLQSRFVHFSQSMLDIFHLTQPDELKGKTDFNFFSEEHARPAFEIEQEIIRTGQPVFNLEEKETHLDGRVSWVLTSKMPWRDKAGKVIGTMGISKDITERMRAEEELRKAQKELLETSRQAGMAEVAIGVLHNVGNVLNSVNVASTCLAEGLQRSKATHLSKVVALLREHEGDLGAYLSNDPKGRQVPAYLAQLAEHLAAEQAATLKELEGLQKNIEHIKGIVAMQQNYSKASGATETFFITDLVEDALRIKASLLAQYHIRVLKEYGEVPPITAEKHRVLQILVNLVGNASQACDEGNPPEKRLTLRVTHGNQRVFVAVMDNGVGIPAENLTRIFAHGFTTKNAGHGFGLHSGALAAKNMGGALTVSSDGRGQGATFTLELPCPARENFHE